MTALHVLQPAHAQRWLAENETNATGGDGLGRPWFVAMRRQIEVVPTENDDLLARTLHEAVRQLDRADTRDVLTVRAVTALLRLPGMSPATPFAIDALRAATTDPRPAVGRAADDAALRRLSPAPPSGPAAAEEVDRPSHEEPAEPADRTQLADPASSRVVLIGGAPLGEGSPSKVATLLRELTALTDPQTWGLESRHLTVLINAGPTEVERALFRAAAEVGPDGLLLVYYAGPLEAAEARGLGMFVSDHGSRRRNRLSLGINHILAASEARANLVMVDLGDTAAVVSHTQNGEGFAHEVWTPPPRRPDVSTHYSFTTGLLRALRSGVQQEPALLTVDTIIQDIERTLPMVMRPRLFVDVDGPRTPLARNRAASDSPLVGRILVAGPAAGGPALDEAVLLVVGHHRLAGTTAVLMNKPDRGAPPVSLAWVDLLAPPAIRLSPGPTGAGRSHRRGAAQAGRATAARLPHAPRPARPPGPVGHRARVAPHLDGVRLVAGYLGWPAGEFEELLVTGELREPESAVTVEKVMTDHPEQLWASLSSRGTNRPSADPDLDDLLDNLVSSLAGGEEVTLILGDDFDRSRTTTLARSSQRSSPWQVGQQRARSAGSWPTGGMNSVVGSSPPIRARHSYKLFSTRIIRRSWRRSTPAHAPPGTR